MQRTNLILGCLLLFFSVFALVWVIPRHTIPASSPLDIPAGFVPSLAASIILLLSLGLILQSLWAKRKKRAPDDQDSEEFHGEITGLGRRQVTDLAIWSAYASLAVLGLHLAGFLVTAPLMLVTAMYFAGCRRRLVIAAVALGAPLLIYQLVWLALTVRLP